MRLSSTASVTRTDCPLRSASTKHGSAGSQERLSQVTSICIDDCMRKLTKDYDLFAYVTSGMEHALATQVGDVMRKVEIEEIPAA